MNPAFDHIISADDETRLGLFTTTAQRLGTTPQNVEKDFWVCWTLDALFNGSSDGPRLLFKIEFTVWALGLSRSRGTVACGGRIESSDLLVDFAM